MAIKFQTNVPQTLCFPYGDFKEVNGQYGEQFLYTVEVDNARDRLYATPMLHEQLQSIGIASGDILAITKVEAEGNRKSWIIQPADQADGNYTPTAPATEQMPATSQTASSQSPLNNPNTANSQPNGRSLSSTRSRTEGSASKSDLPDFATMQFLMNNCLQASWLAWNTLDGETQFTSKDVRKLGISMFIECNRKNILLSPSSSSRSARSAASRTRC